MPRLLDLGAGAGACSVGYHRAGYVVTGVDLLEHADYPYELNIGDMLTWPLDGYDVVHVSPPCQAYSTITPDPDKHPRLIAPMRARLLEWGGLYVIENVEGARADLRHPIKYCGSAFGLAVRRHRYFETNAPLLLMQRPCQHGTQGRPVGVYGDHPQFDADYRRPDGTRRGQKAANIDEAGAALGIDWMTSWDDLTDAIPPAFTYDIGTALLEHLASVAA